MTVDAPNALTAQQWSEMFARLSDRELANELMALHSTDQMCRSVPSWAVTTEAARRLRERT